MSSTTDSAKPLVDPRQAYAAPPFEHQDSQAMPGQSHEMTPTPDHGEDWYEGSGKLKGLNAVVTGSDSGIGRAVALCYAREGANVVINYLSEDKDAERTQELVEQAGSKALVVRGDLRDEAFCGDLIERSLNELGSVDILVNNAAYQETRENLEDFSTELFDRILKTNVYATFWLCRAALKQMPAGGSIINTASIQGYRPSPALLPYATTKSALLGMTKGLAKLAIEHGVRVNAVAPGPVWTPLIPGTFEKDKLEQFGGTSLFGRPAQPIELAPLYVWLASREASYVTGEVYSATGGKSPL